MALAPGTRLGVYEVVSKLGEGGMGEVYRARDPKLGRDVAIKILPSAFQHDADRLARFEREARTLASISHPNIAAIYGFHEQDDVNAIVLELVEGETLADRIQRGALPIAESLALARQIAAALDAAHEKGIVHRDLKPANIKITRDGTAKVLDFGLAKVEDAEPEVDQSQSPTVTATGTRAGVILGTAPYMSPEQARGVPLDKRTDIWSFGCVLFEMLTGKPAFSGATVTDTLAAIIEREPNWQALPSSTPLPIRRLLERCLTKDRKQRLRDVGEVSFELDAPQSRVRDRSLLPWLIAASVVVLASAAAFWYRETAARPVTTEAPVQLTDFNDSALAPALSPDGRLLTFLRGGSFGDSSFNRTQVYVKVLPSGEPVQLTHDDRPKEQPVFSPDASRIVYTAVTAGFRWDSWQVPVLGGTPQPFLPNASGLVWLDQRQMLYAEMEAGVHMGIASSEESRSNHRTIYMPVGENSMAHRAARSPDGKSVLLVEMDGGGWMPCRLMPFDASSTGRAVGPPDAQCTTVAWSPDGRWMYFSSNAGGGFHIWRQRFPDGTPEQITTGPLEQEGTAITPDGMHLVTSMGNTHAGISLHDAAGERALTSEGFAMLPVMSPTANRMFYLVRNTGTRAYASGDLWSMDIDSGQKERILPGRIIANYSISHDGKKVAFTSAENESGGDGVWIADVDRRTPPRQLTHGQEYRAFFGAPGEIIYMTQGTVRHLRRMNEDGTGDEQISDTPVTHLFAVSPDGHWAAALLPQGASGGTAVGLISTRGEKMFTACTDGCSIGFGPNRVQSGAFNWSADGTSFIVALQYYGLRTKRTVVLPYRTGVALDQLWPKGLRQESDVAANPGATVINEPDIFPVNASSYLVWRRSTQSNLYSLTLPQ